MAGVLKGGDMTFAGSLNTRGKIVGGWEMGCVVITLTA